MFKMSFNEYVAYHLRGDASVEENFTAAFVKFYKLNKWDSFRFLYYYALTYSLPSSIKLLHSPNIKKSELKFRTDRRYVGICGRFEKCMHALDKAKMEALYACRSTKEQYDLVSDWYYFGRYAAYLFLECFYKINPSPCDNLEMKFSPKENYTKGAKIICGCKDQASMNNFIDKVKQATGDNVFSIETSLCAVEKFRKGTRWDGFYTERLINNLSEAGMSNYISLIR